jgi:hypothetical protein
VARVGGGGVEDAVGGGVVAGGVHGVAAGAVEGGLGCERLDWGDDGGDLGKRVGDREGMNLTGKRTSRVEMEVIVVGILLRVAFCAIRCGGTSSNEEREGGLVQL